MARDVVKIRIKRYNPESKKIWWQEYDVPIIEGMTVLDALLYIKENIDSTLAIRYSCRMGICGSCGMLINGVPRLACYTQIGMLGTKTIVIEPLPNFPVIRDLATDFTLFFEKHRIVKPYLIRRDKYEQENPVREYRMLPEELDEIKQFVYCIYCGLCYSACPITGVDREYLGPQALMYAYRFIIDVRDEGFVERLNIVDDTHGCHRCHLALSCSSVCPKGVDPGYAIQMLRKMLLHRNLGKLKIRTRGSPVVEPLKHTPKYAKKPPQPTIENPQWENSI